MRALVNVVTWVILLLCLALGLMGMGVWFMLGVGIVLCLAWWAICALVGLAWVALSALVGKH